MKAEKAYDRAEQAALTKAIENALGTIIDATTIADSGVVLEETIYAKKKGYIRNYQVTSKRVEDGIAYVNITAQVGMQELKDDVMGLDIMQNKSHEYA